MISYLDHHVTAVITVPVIMYLMAREGMEDIRPLFIANDSRMAFNSSDSPSSSMLYRIGTIVHNLKPARIPLHAGNGLLKVVQNMILLKMRLHIK